MPKIGQGVVLLAETKCERTIPDGEIETARAALEAEIYRLNRNGNPVDDAGPDVTALWAALRTIGLLWPHDVQSFLASAHSVSMSLGWWLRINRPDDPRTLILPAYTSEENARENEQAIMAALLLDVVGNPFRPVTADPAWLTSDDVALAEGIYQERAFDRMPILADALQDAGCDNEDVLNHCRSEGPHVRGCWVIDLLTGRT